MMNNQDIINNIKNKLTGNKETDKAYLKEELLKYKKENNNEVAFAISQILFSFLNEDERKKYDNIAREILMSRKKEYEYALKCVKENKLEKAKSCFLKLLSTYDKVHFVSTNLYYDFEQMIEYIIYCKTFKRSVELNIHRYPEPVTNFCYQLAAIAIEENNDDEAIKYLQKALTYNPRGMYLYEELIKLYLKLENYDEAFKLIKEVLLFAYKKEQFAFLYQALGKCFKKFEKYPISIASFVVSDHFAGEAFNKNEILEIVKTSGLIKFNDYSEILKLFDEEKINYGPSKELLETVNDFLGYFTYIKNYNSLNYLLQIMIDLTGADYYKNKQQEIKDLQNEKK